MNRVPRNKWALEVRLFGGPESGPRCLPACPGAYRRAQVPTGVPRCLPACPGAYRRAQVPRLTKIMEIMEIMKMMEITESMEMLES